jgi:maltose phosphorylase
MVTFTGIECHNEWEITFEEIHRNGSIAYAIYNYTNYTGDESWLLLYGVNVLVEISRFWAGRVHFSKHSGQYMIHGVTGPNEYENNVNNNWYTNYIARWVLEYTLECLAKVSVQKNKSLNVTDHEMRKWKEIASNMYIPQDDDLGIFVQHDTFLDKDLQSADKLKSSDRPLNQNWSWDRILRSCYIKQADVLQGIYNFFDAFSREEVSRNFDFYEPITVHESSLSSSIHSILAARLGMEKKAVELYTRTARLDLDDYNNDTEDGLHITSMSGSWLAIVQGFAGMRIKNGLPAFYPFCPETWQGYSFKVLFRQRLLEVVVDKTNVRVFLREGEPIELYLFDKHLKVDTVNNGCEMPV